MINLEKLKVLEDLQMRISNTFHFLDHLTVTSSQQQNKIEKIRQGISGFCGDYVANILSSASFQLGNLEKPASSKLAFDNLEFLGLVAFDGYCSDGMGMILHSLPARRIISSANTAHEQNPSFVAW